LATLKQVGGAERLAHIALAALTLVSSWLLVPTMFTTHYADMFYSAAEDARPLAFPNTPMPIFWDFAYFSFTIAAACQTSDVATNNHSIRRIVIAHTLVSFFFNASILGFAINVTAGLIGGSCAAAPAARHTRLLRTAWLEYAPRVEHNRAPYGKIMLSV
jgi:uncharacterized membrane protein